MDIHLEEGGVWDEKEITISTDYTLKQNDRTCRHVEDGKLKAIVLATNEGGYNSTGTCVQCIVEAVKENNIL